MTTDIQKINEEVTRELANKETLNALVTTTFKGLQEGNVKKAIVEGLIRGFTFDDFLKKNIYAIPFTENRNTANERQVYSLVTSIDYARKLSMRSGAVGSLEPVFEIGDKGNIISCSVTVKRKIGDTIGDFTAKVFFSEYTTGKNLWTSKPRTMIAKVAEMHALRKAFPEELSQMYTVDEMGEKVIDTTAEKVVPVDPNKYQELLGKASSLEELKKIWDSTPTDARVKLESFKNDCKIKLLQ